MVLLKTGENMVINDTTITIGATVIANDKSIYKGRIGEVIEIRTEGDKETDNHGPDIYVNFDNDIVIMAEEMLKVLGN